VPFSPLVLLPAPQTGTVADFLEWMGCGIADAEDLQTCSRVWAAVSDAETARRRGGAPRLSSVDGASGTG
jgi:hypothetical protein